MNADDIHDFLIRVKEAEEIGFAPDVASPGVSAETLGRKARCLMCKREVAEQNGYRTGAGFICCACSSNFDDDDGRI
jgi:hypothetical protein